jgi:hypothetical protein
MIFYRVCFDVDPCVPNRIQYVCVSHEEMILFRLVIYHFSTYVPHAHAVNQ